MTVSLKDGNIVGEIPDSQGVLMASLGGDFTDIRSGMRQQFLAAFKYYKFKSQKAFESRESSFLLPPNGNNLMSLLVSNKELRIAANQPFLSRGLRLGLRPQEFKIEVIKDVDDVIISSPYSLSSDTYQRLVFYLAAILTNKDSVLVFEEPEAHAFPFYTKYLAEMIVLEENNNQYFISTHNPYFLMPLIEKAPIDDLAVFITYYEDYQTKVKLLDRSELERLTEIDVFSNLPAFLEDD